jgi:hypothetical protein
MPRKSTILASCSPESFGEGVEILGEGLLVPLGLRGGGGGLRNFDAAGIEDAVEYCFEEEKFGGGDVAEEFVGGFGAGIGLVAGFVCGDGFEDFFWWCGFRSLSRRERRCEEEVSLLRGDVSHDESPLRV